MIPVGSTISLLPLKFDRFMHAKIKNIRFIIICQAKDKIIGQQDIQSFCKNRSYHKLVKFLFLHSNLDYAILGLKECVVNLN